MVKLTVKSNLRATSKRALFFACCFCAILSHGPNASAQVARPRMKPVPQAKTLAELIQNFEAQKGKPYIERYRYISQFRRFQTEESARYLEKIYKEDTDANIKRSALSTLSSMRVPYARKVIAAIAKDPKTDSISLTYAIRGLSSSTDLESFKILLSLLQAPPNGQASWPARSQESRRNTDVLKGLRDSRTKNKSAVLVSEVLSQPKGKLLWKKQRLVSIAATKAARVEHKDVFLKLSHEKYPELRAEAVYALDSDPLSDDVSKRLIHLLSDKSPVVATASTIVLGKHGPEGALKPLLKIAKGKNAGAAAAALEALGAYPDDKGAFSALKKALGKKRPWQLAAAAIAGLEKRHKVDTIDVLVKALKKLDGRLLADACKALKTLTGQDLGLKAKDWKNWWAAVKKGFTMPDKAALAKRKEKGPKVRNATKSRNPSYYGSEVVSKRITFIVDFSGSMSAKMKTLEGESTRLELAKSELIKVVKGLSKSAYFNLIFFGTSFKAWQKTIVKASKGIKSKAIQHTQTAAGMGGTNIYDPLEKALQDPNVDTIYLLSDGSPGSGKFTVPSDILREIKKINATRRIVIHTISFGSDSQFLKDLAKQNGGNYIKR